MRTFVDVIMRFASPEPESADFPCRISETVRCKLNVGAGAAPVENQIAVQLARLGHDNITITNAIYTRRRLQASAKPARRPWNSET
jgi:hypothetical protein